MLEIFKMWLPLLLVIFASSLLLLVFKTKNPGKSVDKKKKHSKLWLILKSVYKFCFVYTSEDRLDAFKYVHLSFPRFTRFKFLNLDYLIIYDPDLCKKVYNSQSACQRSYRNIFRLDFGLLASECKFSKQ